MNYAVQDTSVSAVSPSGLRLAVALEQISNEATSEFATTSTSFPTEQAPHSASQHHQQQTTSLSPKRDARDRSPNIAAANERGYSSAIPSHPPPRHRVAIATSTFTATSWTTTASKGASSPPPSTPPPSVNDDNPTVVTCSVKAAVTALQWLDDFHLACGLQDGTVTLLARDARSNLTASLNLGDSAAWTPTLSRCFHRVACGGNTPSDQGRRRVVRIRLSGQGTVGGKDGMGSSGAARGGGDLGGGPGDALTLWILYEDRVVVCVAAEALGTLARQRADSVNTATTDETSTTADQQPHSPGSPSSPPSAGSGPSFAKLQLEGQDEILDVAACPAPAGLFELRQDRHSHVVLAAGVSPALAFYLVGSETRSIGLASIAWAVASRVTSLTVGAIDGIFGFAGLRGRGRRRRKATAAAEVSARGGSEDGDGREESPPPLVLRWDGGLQDGRRRVTSLCLDPSGRFAAAADGFGRVMLVDCATRQVLRMWKGVRDAQCGWLEVAESWIGRRVSFVGANSNENQSALHFATTKITTNDGDDSAATPVIGLYLAILAPLRGRVDIWRMRHGPCIRVVPAPTGARLLTSKSIARGHDEAGNDGGEAGEGGGARTLTSCYLLSGGSAGAATGEAVTRLRLNPLLVEEADLAGLPTRLSREATVDDDCRLRQFGAALAEIRRSQGTTSTSETRTSKVADRERLQAGRESREEILFEFLVQLESVENLARAMVALGGRRGDEHGRDETRQTGAGSARSNDGITLRPRASQPPHAPSPTVRPGEQSSRASSTATRTDAVVLSHSFHRRVCALCRERAEQASTETASSSAAFDSNLERDNDGEGAQDAANSSIAAAVAVLRFRANAYELYALLSSVEIQPAGAAGEDEDGDPAFLPPGKRGWKHALLCEEAAGWAEMARKGVGSPRGTRLSSAELPDFQEFFDTVSRVLELPQPAPPPQGKFSRAMGNGDPSIPSLRFMEIAGDRGTTEGATGSRPRRSSGNGKASPGSEVAFSSQTSDEGFALGATSSADVLDSGRAKCRERLIGWLFRPLLSDAFAMASLSQALNMLGMGGRSQAVALVRDMSAWFLALPVGRAADITVGREAQNCPVLRWLKAIIVLAMAPSDDKSNLSASGSSVGNWERDSDRMLGKGEKIDKTDGVLKKRVDRVAGVITLFGDDVANVEAESEDVQGVAAAVSKGSVGGAADASGGGEDEREDDEEHEEVGDDSGDIDNDDDDVDSNKYFQAEAEALLQPMYDACAASQQLENAVMLAVVTAEALSASRERLEESSLGRVAIGGGEAWVALARRLRMCLFVDHRLRWGIPHDGRNRASVRQFEEGKASIYALVAKDQLMSFDDLSFAACSSRENAEVEASVRSQREAAEAKPSASRELSGPERAGKLGQEAVPAAPTLADSSMDKYWREVQAVAARKGDPASKSKTSSSPSFSETFSLNLAIARLSTTGTVTVTADKRVHRKGNNPAVPKASAAVVDQSQQSKRQSSPSGASTTAQTAPTTLFFMRSHAQPTVLACHRARWLVRSWAAIGPAAARDIAKAESAGRPLSSVAEKARAAEGAVCLLSLAVDHLSYLRTAKPFLAACVGYWLWEHGGVRAHAGELARGIVTHDGGDDDIPINFADSSNPQVSVGKSELILTEAGRPAREAFLAAAEEFLHVEALFSGGRQEGATRGGRWGSKGGSENSFLSLLTAGTVQRCPWPGAWDVWLEECLRDAQVHPPLPSAVAAHATMLRALRVNTVCGLQEGETQRLFAHGNALCAEAALRDERLATPASVRDVNEEGARIVACREAYVRRALEAIVPRPAQNVYRLARDFGLGEDTVRGWHCLVLLRRGHDVLGEEAMAQVYSLQELAGEILTILRLRLKRILDYLETSPKSSGGLLARLDADTCEWVRSAKDSEADRAAGSGDASDKAKGEPLRSTHGVLLCLGRALPPDSRYKRQADSLLTLVGTMLRQLDGAMF